MSVLTFAISCLTTFNLLIYWFMDLTFSFLCNIALYSIGFYFHHQSQTVLFCFVLFFALAPSLHFFLDLFLHSSPVAYWASTDLGSSSFSVISLRLFILFTEFSRQEYWSCLPFPSPVDHVLSELSTMIHPSWVAHSFIELDKAVVHVIRLFSFLWLWFPSCLPSDGAG